MISSDVKSSVYRIFNQSGSGSGFMMDGFRYVVTNFHVVYPYMYAAVEDMNKNRYKAKVVMLSKEDDLAFLSLQELEDHSSCITMPVDEGEQKTDEIYVVGYPLGMPITITKGVVSSYNQLVGKTNLVQTDAAVNHGNSGGPMLTKDAKLVAVTNSVIDSAENIGFGIPVNVLKKQIDSFGFDDDELHIKCDSCETFLKKDQDTCNNCGKTSEIKVKTQTAETKISEFVKNVLTDGGYDYDLCKVGVEYWEFYKENALVRIFERDRALYIVSPINQTPKKDIQEALEYIVSSKEHPFLMGIYEDAIYLSYRVDISEIDSSRIDVTMRNFALFLQRVSFLQEMFFEKYNAKYSKLSKHHS